MGKHECNHWGRTGRATERGLHRARLLHTVTISQTLIELTPRWKHHSGYETQHADNTICQNKNKDLIHQSRSCGEVSAKMKPKAQSIKVYSSLKVSKWTNLAVWLL